MFPGALIVDPSSTMVVRAENREEMFQLCLGGDGKDLIASVVEGFVIWPLDHGGVSGLARLLLPSEFRNVISRPSGSNSAVLNKSKDIAIAGVREFIFVWDIASEQLLKQLLTAQTDYHFSN